MRTGNRHPCWKERLIDGVQRLVTRVARQPVGGRKGRHKSVGYHDLLKVLERLECPVCYVMRRSLQGYLSTAVLEQITMPEFREPLRKSFGYCKRHSEYARKTLRNRSAAKGVAIIYQDLLSLARKHMRDQTSVPVPSGCPLCVVHRDVERQVVERIADCAGDPEFQGYYENASGVCLPHFMMILELLEGDVRTFMLQSHIRKLRHQLGNLEEFIRKHDYRFTHEKMTEQEAVSRKTAVRFVTGS